MKQTLILLEAKQAANDDRLGFYSPPRPVINCRNGEIWVYDSGKVKLKPHNPRSYLRSCLDVSHDATAQSPEYDKTLREIFSKSETERDLCDTGMKFRAISSNHSVRSSCRDCARTWVEWEDSPSSNNVPCTGPELMIAMKIEDLGASRFAFGSLFGKRLLLDDDVKKGIRLPDGELKKASEARR
jgi:phage/plasmid-associated DNA primase